MVDSESGDDGASGSGDGGAPEVAPEMSSEPYTSGEERSTEGPVPSCVGWDNGSCVGTEYCQPRCPRFFTDGGEALLVRRYCSDDREELHRMYDRIAPSDGSFGVPPPAVARRRAWLDDLTREGWNLLAFAGRDVVGHVCAAPADQSAPEVLVFVRPDYRGCGVGTELLKQLVAYAEAGGHESLTLSVGPENQGMLGVATNLEFDLTGGLPTELTMALSLECPIARHVQRPPAERD